MLTKKLTDKSLCGVLVFLGLVILLVVYLVPYKNFTDQISSLESENNTIRNHISSLKEYYDNRSQYEEDTEVFKKKIAEIASAYPSMYRIEDYIMEAVDVDEGAELNFTSIDVANAETLVVIDEDTVKGANIDEYQSAISFNEQTVTYSNEIDYHSLKDALAVVFNSDYKLNIQNISYTCDEETGVLNGAIALGYYYVSGNGMEYTAPSINNYTSGTSNIFGAIYDNIEEETEDGTEAETSQEASTDAASIPATDNATANN